MPSLLFLVASPRPDPAALAEAARAIPAARWARVREAALAEGLAPLLFFRLRGANLLGAVPGSCAEALRRDLLGSSAANLVRFEALRSVLPALDAALAPAIVLKGAALAGTLYEEPGLRPMGDADLLVGPERMSAADAVLRALGYAPVDAPGALPAGVPDSPLASLDYRTKDPMSVSLHVHWSLWNSTIPTLARPGSLPPGDLLARSARPEIAPGLSARVLSPPDLALHLCEHLLKVPHSASRLLWLSDLARALAGLSAGGGWEAFAARAREAGLERPAAVSLSLAAALAGARLPGDPADLLGGVRLRAGERLFRALALRGRRAPGLSILVHLSARRGLAAKARFLKAVLFPPPSALARRAGPSGPSASRLARLGEVSRAAINGIRRLVFPRV